jgi:hypothetical protein
LNPWPAPNSQQVAVTVLEALPPNNSLNEEYVGYLFQDDEGDYHASLPKRLKIVQRNRQAIAFLYIPPEKKVVAVYHDHFTNTLPGPGLRDGDVLLNGFVHYLRDAWGNIYKIEYARHWATRNNRNNGWRLTTLKGHDLDGQEIWRPGISFSRYRYETKGEN